MTPCSCTAESVIRTSPMIRSRNLGAVAGVPARVGVCEIGLNGGADGLGPMPRTERGEVPCVGSTDASVKYLRRSMPSQTLVTLASATGYHEWKRIAPAG